MWLAAVLATGACAGQPGVTGSPQAAPLPRAAEQAAPPPSAAARGREQRFLTVAAVGDLMLGTDYPENHLPDDDGAGFLADVASLLRAPDLTIGNLEGVLVDGGTPRKACKNPRACFLFRSPTRYAQHYVDAGFDVLSLANNHARDFGEEGRTETMRALEAVGIAHSGREGDFASVTVGERRIAVLAFAVTQMSNLLHDYPLAERIVREQAGRHDIVIVSFHGGAEGGDDVTRLPFAEEWYYGEPRGDVVYFARKMVDAGADLVFGHGPHVVRAMERYGERLIAYSLGNFATYYGISVDDLNGIAPILVATLDGEGRFVNGQLHSTVQIRPGGPQRDPSHRAARLVRDLSLADFDDPGLRFLDDGRILPGL